MGTLNWTVLMGRIGCSWFDLIASFRKKIDNSSAATKFTTEIKANVLVGAGGTRRVSLQPAVEKLKGRLLGTKCFTMESATVVVSNQDIASFTIKPFEAADPSRVGRRVLNDEAKIDTDALKTTLSTAGIIGTTSFLV
jgi:hypothetical protein